MLAVFLASALSGSSFGNAEVPPADGVMEISNLTSATVNVGACPAVGDLPTTDAKFELLFTAVNRDDDVYRIDVYLEDLDAAIAGGALMTGVIGWTQGWEVGDTHRGFGRLQLLGEIEDGPFNRHTVRWRFYVRVVRISDSTIMQTLKTDWTKTYGSCS